MGQTFDVISKETLLILDKLKLRLKAGRDVML
jgi:hypothetical protein